MSNINFGANLLFKNPVGFVIPLIISLTEWVLGRTVLMDDPNGILPINNTEIVGNKIYGEYINYDTFLKPIIYWVIIIVVTIIFINLIINECLQLISKIIKILILTEIHRVAFQ
jgi:hypothetical protein